MKTNLEIIKASYAASEVGDAEGILADVAADIKWTEMEGYPYGGTYTGPEEIVEGVFKRILDDWDDYRVITDRYYDAGDSIIVSGWYAGTYKKTGKSLKCRVVHLWELAEGKIVRFEQFTDSKLVADAIS